MNVPVCNFITRVKFREVARRDFPTEDEIALVNKHHETLETSLYDCRAMRCV